MAAGDTTSYDTIVGRMVVEQRLCTEEEVRRCLEELKERASSRPATLEQLLLEKQFLTPSQAARLQSMIRESKDVSSQIPGYKILGKLGSGAMAVVYKAKQISLDRTVAIKVLPKKFVQKSDYVERFYKEGRIAAKMNHNNIVQAIDVGEVGGLYYFVMEYVEGRTLYDDLSKGKIFSEKEAIDIILQLASALGHAHSLGLVHRDVKPKNIMISKDGVVKLADMGLARETTDVKAAKHEQGKAFGTPYYIAPEQIRGLVDIDGRADIYALGATLFHMVTGRVPFEASTPSEVMRKHLKEPLTPPDHINTSLTAGISEVIEVMMAKEREERYRNMEEVIADLQAVRDGKPPLLARQKFDVEALEQLEEGMAIETTAGTERVYTEEMIAKYRIGLLALGILSAILLLVILFLVMR
ncbi:MAG TPA: serine/threonine-protein kinase [Anaerohalosphaeraceae bacterium]|nr:serine/threonine-protein kinase [Anaerohalosphaeraceae bacterium]HPC64101.1 serine/threonine-protein kinase [Anaerohalosphaeraceae bacterium]HRV19378.1 serine/threonine-protein kinase [Anaerohalosphaeraceae bacterium]